MPHKIILAFFISILMLAFPASAEITFSDTEKSAILSLGPWPQESQPDSSNKYSGVPAAITLGKMLFFDRRLSKNNQLSCADCHHSDKYFSDGIALNRGLSPMTRHTPPLINLRWQHWFGWGGENDNLWAQSIRPILSKTEMGGSLKDIKHLIEQDQHLKCQFETLFKTSIKNTKEEALAVMIGKTLAAFQETLVTKAAAFDKFRDGLRDRDEEAMASYPASAKRGLRIFVGKGRCNLCHTGAQFSSGEFADIGISHFTQTGEIDKGRYGGITAMKSNPLNLLGQYNDSPNNRNNIRTRHIAQLHRNWGEFKIPSLRNVVDTAPYMHNGSLKNLSDVIDHYSEIDEERLHVDGEKILRPLFLSDKEKEDLQAFLQTLSAPLKEGNVEKFSYAPICN